MLLLLLLALSLWFLPSFWPSADLLMICAVQTEPFDWPSSILCHEGWSLPSLFATLFGEWFIGTGDEAAQNAGIVVTVWVAKMLEFRELCLDGCDRRSRFVKSV